MKKKGDQNGSMGEIYGVYILRIYPSKVLLKLLRKVMKRQQSEEHPCHRHQFSLSSKQDNIIRPLHVKASFCLQTATKASNLSHNHTKCRQINCPTFNLDRNCTTPTFVLYQQRNNYQNSQSQIRYEPQDILIASSQNSSINVPKPSLENKYCSVCSNNYQDYRQHIQEQNHRQNIRKSRGNKYILKLAKQYGKKTHGIRKRRERSGLKKVPATTENASHSFEIIEKQPRNNMSQLENGPCFTPKVVGFSMFQNNQADEQKQKITTMMMEVPTNWSIQQQMMAWRMNIQGSMDFFNFQNIPQNQYYYPFSPGNPWRPPLYYQPKPKKNVFTFIIIEE